VNNAKETFAKRPLLPNFCACPVKCEAYFSGVRLKVRDLRLELESRFSGKHFSKVSKEIEK
jgi:hypothetical protein